MKAFDCKSKTTVYVSCDEFFGFLRVINFDSAGFWSDWSGWSACSKSCGGGGRRGRTRTCQGGATCVGSAREIEVCKLQDCPGE